MDFTRREWTNNADPQEVGTGIFYDYRLLKDFVPDITYSECIDLARNKESRHFKWVPNYVEDYARLLSAQCSGGPCVFNPDDKDPPCFESEACNCVEGKCI